MCWFFNGAKWKLKQYNHLLPNPEEIFTKLNSGKVFSKLDLLDADLQVNEECTKLLTVKTH